MDLRAFVELLDGLVVIDSAMLVVSATCKLLGGLSLHAVSTKAMTKSNVVNLKLFTQ